MSEVPDLDVTLRAKTKPYREFDGIDTVDLLVMSEALATHKTITVMGTATGVRDRVREELARRGQAEIVRARHELLYALEVAARSDKGPQMDTTSDLTVVLHLTGDAAENLLRAAHDLGIPHEHVLAMLAGRVEVESAGRLRLAGEEEA